jgi:hypothetical protein
MAANFVKSGVEIHLFLEMISTIYTGLRFFNSIEDLAKNF